MNKIKKIGLAPGTLIHTGLRRREHVTITLIDYDQENINEVCVTDLETLRGLEESTSTTWINIDGLHDTSVIEKLGDIFRIHPLVQEDILNTDQRPKVDLHDEYIFVVLKMLNYNEALDIFETEQLSLILGHNFVLSFQEEAGDSFDTVRERIRKGSRIRNKKADYLMYALMDATVDSYYYALERMGEWIQELENNIIKNPNRRRSFEISDLKRDMVMLRKNIWPVRELMHKLQRYEDKLIAKDTKIFLDDIYDHTIQMIDNIETYRDMISNLMDLYLSNLSYKMNDVMKTLTMIATIFIPITFITSLYGMNFKYIPELESRFGYFGVLLIIAISTIGMIIYFRKKGWF